MYSQTLTDIAKQLKHLLQHSVGSSSLQVFERRSSWQLASQRCCLVDRTVLQVILLVIHGR